MKKYICIVGVVSFLLSLSGHANAQSDVSTAKAMFIYNFTRYIEWPKEANNGNFVISVYGSNQLFNELKEYLSNKLIGTRSITVQKASSSEGIENCQVLFVGFGKTKELKDLKIKIEKNNTLVISEKEGALDDGAAINFVLVGDKLTYEIRQGNAAKAGLKFNSQIFNFAKSKS